MADIAKPRSWPSQALAFLARSSEIGLLVGTVCTLALIYAFDRRGSFFSAYSLESLIHAAALYGVLAIGVSVVIIAGGIDLSIGSVAALASVICAKLLTTWLRGGDTSPPSIPIIALAIGLTLLLGLAIGLVHAVEINYLRLPAFIATLATMASMRSAAAILSGNKSITVPYEWFRVWGRNSWYSVTIFVVVALSASLVMGATVLGRHLYALGGNETAARLSGLPTRRLRAFAYGLSGVLAALAGILFAGKTGQADSRLGVSYELIAITAAVVGGCSLSGGVGTIRGTVLGLFLIQIVIKATGQLAPRGIDATQIEGLVLGTVVVLAVGFNQRFRGRG
jgi:ribose/xylose/arabinose/galactoside ABC-type transport system permease subunit